ncbi:MAG: ATP synthase subunit C [Rhodomicrobiaceae bacterium]
MKISALNTSQALAVVAIVIGAFAVLLLHVGLASAQEAAQHAADPAVLEWAFASAAVAAGLAALAAGYAVAMVGSAAVGALAEKPELLGRVLILVGLAEGIAIYGLIVAILILNRAG